MSQRRLVAGALTLVVLAVIGLLYLQAIEQGNASRPGWLLTREVMAGTVLEESNVKRVRIAGTGEQFAVLQESPLHRRASHRMHAQTLLTADDLLGLDMVQVPLTAQVAVSVRSAPSLGVGDSVDVYAVVGSRTVLVGRHLVVVGNGSPLNLLVSAGDEPSWIALQANNVALFAAKSSGVGVPAGGPGVAVNDAISSLSGSAENGAVLTNSNPPAPSAPPAPSSPPPSNRPASPSPSR
jgi:hypothetical protein